MARSRRLEFQGFRNTTLMGDFAFRHAQRAREFGDRALERLHVSLVLLSSTDQFGVCGFELGTYPINLGVSSILDRPGVFIACRTLFRRFGLGCSKVLPEFGARGFQRLVLGEKADPLGRMLLGFGLQPVDQAVQRSRLDRGTACILFGTAGGALGGGQQRSLFGLARIQNGTALLECIAFGLDFMLRMFARVLYGLAPEGGHGLTYFFGQAREIVGLAQSICQAQPPRIQHAGNGVRRPRAELVAHPFDRGALTCLQQGVSSLINLLLRDSVRHFEISDSGALPHCFCTDDKR